MNLIFRLGLVFFILEKGEHFKSASLFIKFNVENNYNMKYKLKNKIKIS